jgi:hypothetical protein
MILTKYLSFKARVCYPKASPAAGVAQLNPMEAAGLSALMTSLKINQPTKKLRGTSNHATKYKRSSWLPRINTRLEEA